MLSFNLYAAFEGHKKVVQLLLYHGADPDIINKYGESASGSATAGKHIDLAKLLMFELVEKGIEY